MGDALPSQQNALRMLNTASPVVMDMPKTVAMRRGSGQQLREKAFWPNIEVTGMDCHSSDTRSHCGKHLVYLLAEEVYWLN